MQSDLIKKHALFLLITLALSMGLLCIALPAWFNLVEFLGKRIPQGSVWIDYLQGLLWAVFLGTTIFFWPVSSSDKKALAIVWAVKCFVMLGVMLFYEYHYQIDSYAYFSGARFDMSLWHEKYCDGPNLPPILFIRLHQDLLLDSYHAVKVSFGFVGLAAIFIFYRAAIAFLRREKVLLLYIFAFFPSILFWSSTFGKDPLGLFSITIYCYGTIAWVRRGSWPSVGILLAGVFSITFMRPWMGVIMAFPVLVITIFCMKKSDRVKMLVLSCALFLISAVSVQSAFSYLGVGTGRSLTSVANEKFIDFSRGGSGRKTTGAADGKTQVSGRQQSVKFGRGWDMLQFVPRGMFTALFRPLPGEVKNLFGLIAGLEDVLLLGLFTLMMIRGRWKELSDPLLLWAFLFILGWSAAYGFISYNLGTVCRYRLQILPVMLGFMLYMGRKK
ncbi:MAG: hypothetical protein WC695_03860 [Candidatus Omnitrophota bacterium]